MKYWITFNEINMLLHMLHMGAGIVFADGAAGQFYPYSCNPEDIHDGLGKDRDNYFFTDIQARGEYPVWALKRIERAGISGIFADGDAEILRAGTVDFVAFS